MVISEQGKRLQALRSGIRRRYPWICFRLLTRLQLFAGRNEGVGPGPAGLRRTSMLRSAGDPCGASSCIRRAGSVVASASCLRRSAWRVTRRGGGLARAVASDGDRRRGRIAVRSRRIWRGYTARKSGRLRGYLRESGIPPLEATALGVQMLRGDGDEAMRVHHDFVVGERRGDGPFRRQQSAADPPFAAGYPNSWFRCRGACESCRRLCRRSSGRLKAGEDLAGVPAEP